MSTYTFHGRLPKSKQHASTLRLCCSASICTTNTKTSTFGGEDIYIYMYERKFTDAKLNFIIYSKTIFLKLEIKFYYDHYA